MNSEKDWKNSRARNSTANRLTCILLIIYLVVLFWIIVLKMNVSFSYMKGARSINLVPFSKPLILNGKVDYGENILNILIFLPLGVYAGILYKTWATSKKIVVFFLVSFLCETLQLALNIGAFDVTDIINNTLGAIIGFVLFKVIEKLFKNEVTTQRFINIVAAAGTITMIVLLLLLKTNNLWIHGRHIRYQ
ncbi:MAG: VanZ family protein [Chitinophagaceae bacterium]